MLNIADKANNLKKVRKVEYDYSYDLSLQPYLNMAAVTDEALAIEIQSNKVTPKLEKELNKILKQQQQSEEDEDGNTIWVFKEAVFSFSRALDENKHFLSLLFDGDYEGMDPDIRSDYERTCEYFLKNTFLKEMKKMQIKFNKSVPDADFDADEDF